MSSRTLVLSSPFSAPPPILYPPLPFFASVTPYGRCGVKNVRSRRVPLPDGPAAVVDLPLHVIYFPLFSVNLGGPGAGTFTPHTLC